MSQARWQAVWLDQSRHRGWLACLLWPVSLIYGVLVGVRRRLFRLGLKQSHRIDVPVVVVGNVVVGGAGKTPAVIAVVNHLLAQGWQPGVVSRGHGRRSEQVVDVRSDTPLSESGDEPALIRLRTGVPVFVSAKRVEAARGLLLAHPQVNILVCDDGLQHLALQRDVEIVVFDDRGKGNGWLLPAGLLREPWPRRSGSDASNTLVLHQRREDAPSPTWDSADVTNEFAAVRRLAHNAVGPTGEQMPLHRLRGPGLTAVAGIARPGVFFDMLRARGLKPTLELALPDHAALSDYAGLMGDRETTLICTEKDAVKLFPTMTPVPGNQQPRVWAVPLELLPDDAFFTSLDERLSSLKRAA